MKKDTFAIFFYVRLVRRLILTYLIKLALVIVILTLTTYRKLLKILYYSKNLNEHSETQFQMLSNSS